MNFKQKVYTTLNSSEANLHYVDIGEDETITNVTGEKVAADLNYLDQKLAAISKDIQVLDILTITGSVGSYEEYLEAVNLLVNGEGISITQSFEGFNTGDIVYKINNQLTHLAFAASGFYYPSKITKDGEGYNITYSYQESVGTPSGNETIDNDGKGTWQTKNTNQATYTFSSLEGVKTSGVVAYNEEITKSAPSTFKVLYRDLDEEHIIMPLIKAYHQTSDDIEEQVECEFTLTLDKQNDKWTISDYPDFITRITVR